MAGRRGAKNKEIADHMRALGVPEDQIITDLPNVGPLVGSIESPFEWDGPAELVDPRHGKLVRVVTEKTERRLHARGFRRVGDERVQMRGVKGGFVMFQPRPLADEAKRQRIANDKRKTSGQATTTDDLNIAGGVTARGKTESKWTPETRAGAAGGN